MHGVFPFVTDLWAFLPGLFLLLAMSSFFSGCEAAFFSLTPRQRRSLAEGHRRDRWASVLLQRPERLLMGILFWNLAVNIGYFSIVSKMSLDIGTAWGEASAAFLTIVSLMIIIVMGEFLPKSLAVTYPMAVSRWVVIPLGFSIRILDGFLPLIKLVNEASRRLLWPGFKSEAYLELADLDRAVELSTEDAQLYQTGSQVLRNIIRLSEIRVEEWMRPRTQYLTFKPPVHIDQLGGQRTPSGYMLVTDAQGQEVVSVIDLSSAAPDQIDNLGGLAQPLVVVPWCATIADALARLKDNGRRVAVVVNEYGETVGILTWEEIFEAILQADDINSHRELAQAHIQLESPGVWLATGMTKLRRLERVVGRRLSTGRSLTIGGVIQEQLHRIPEQGDTCHCAAMRLEVLEAGMRGEILVRVTLDSPQGGTQ